MNNRLYINLSYIVDIDNYNKSLQKWLCIRRQCDQNITLNKKQLFNRYLPIIKPIIHRFVQSISLVIIVTEKLPSKQYGFYTSLQQHQIMLLKKLLPPLNIFQIINTQNKEYKRIQQFSQIQSIYYLDIEIIQPKFPQIYRLKIHQKPLNDELIHWKNILQVPEIQIEQIVLRGKGLGTKELGMPTANIKLCSYHQQKLSQYPNGVYSVNFQFQSGQKYLGAACLGTNPHYQNLKQSRVLQVYVLHEFDENFYEQKVKVTFKKLIRFEGKFHSFDAFLNAMHNDIQTIRRCSMLK